MRGAVAWGKQHLDLKRVPAKCQPLACRSLDYYAQLALEKIPCLSCLATRSTKIKERAAAEKRDRDHDCDSC